MHLKFVRCGEALNETKKQKMNIKIWMVQNSVVCVFVHTTSGVMSIGGLSDGLSFGACSSGNLPLPTVSSFFVSGSAGAASFYIFLHNIHFQCNFSFWCQTNNVFFHLQRNQEKAIEGVTNNETIEQCTNRLTFTYIQQIVW